ncbi:MAG: hypothetical protein WA809_08865, partial [Candidatus Dormiibacterota bacterium]
WTRDGHLASAGTLFALRVGRAALRHPTAVQGAVDALRRLPQSRRERRMIMERRTVEPESVARWAEPSPWRRMSRSRQ